MKVDQKYLKSNLSKYILIWLMYIIFVIWYIMSRIENTIFSIAIFPLNVVLGYLIIQNYEFKRASKYIKKYHSDHWNDIKAHAIGNTIKSSWCNNLDDNFGDENIGIIKKNLRRLVILRLIIIVHIVILLLIAKYIM